MKNYKVLLAEVTNEGDRTKLFKEGFKSIKNITMSEKYKLKCLLPQAIFTTIIANDDVVMKIINAFEPLMSLIQGLSYPITFFMLGVGFLLIITGNKTKGLEILKLAGIGYVGIQFLPSIMKLLVGLGRAIK